MSPDLKWFVVRLAVVGVPEDQGPEETLAIQDDLTARPHLRDPKVTWDGLTRRAIVQVEMEGTDSDSTADQMAEELLEVCSGVLLAPGPSMWMYLAPRPQKGVDGTRCSAVSQCRIQNAYCTGTLSSVP